MIHTEFLGWGLQMTVLGMGLVFVLLALLWLLLTVVLKLDKAEEGTAEKAAEKAGEAGAEAREAAGAEPAGTTPEAPTVNGLPADRVAAILVAVYRHRQTMRRQAAPPARAVWPDGQIFASPWLAAGRARQTRHWQPRGR